MIYNGEGTLSGIKRVFGLAPIKFNLRAIDHIRICTHFNPGCISVQFLGYHGIYGLNYRGSQRFRRSHHEYCRFNSAKA
jgi:hypothetical protein